MSEEARITIELVPSATAEVRALIAELEEILSAEYPLSDHPKPAIEDPLKTGQ